MLSCTKTRPRDMPIPNAQAWEAIGETVGAFENEARDERPPKRERGTLSPEVQWVRCTSGGTGTRAGVVLSHNGSFDDVTGYGASFTDLGTCWIRELNGSDLLTDSRYLARRSGQHDVGGDVRALFLVDTLNNHATILVEELDGSPSQQCHTIQFHQGQGFALTAGAGSMLVSMDNASATSEGIVSTTTQTFAGVKTFTSRDIHSAGIEINNAGTGAIRLTDLGSLAAIFSGQRSEERRVGKERRTVGADR